MFGFRFFWTLSMAMFFCVPHWGQARAMTNAGTSDLPLVAAVYAKKGYGESNASQTHSSAKIVGKQTKSAKEHAKTQNKKNASAKAAHSPQKEKPAAATPAALSPHSKPSANDRTRHKKYGLLPPPSVELPQSGIASWIGRYFHGRPVALSGEIHDMESLTAAHRAIAFHSILKVTDLNTGRSILVRINDRGPYVRGRVIDLAKGAAEYLGYVDKGITRVRLDFAGTAKDPDLRYYIRLRPAKGPGKAEPVQGFGPFDKFDEAASLFISLYKSYPDAELTAVRKKA